MGLASYLSMRLLPFVLSKRKTRQEIYRRMFQRSDILFLKELEDHQILSFADEIVGWSVFDSGDFGRDMVAKVQRILAAANLDPKGKTVLDVGANIGTQSIYFCKDLECGKVLAFEPDPRTFSVLKRNFILNDLTSTAEAFCLAASDSIGTARFKRSVFNRGASSLEMDHAKDQSDEFIEVKTESLDAFLSKLDVLPDTLGLIWIDVEGHELQVLSGLEETLKSNAAPLIFEFTPDGSETKPGQIFDLVSKYYSRLSSLSDPDTPLNRDNLIALDGQIDVLALP